MPERRPVAVIAGLEQEAHALVARMPRSETVGPRLSLWEGGGLVVAVAGVGKVAAAMTAQFVCDVFRPRCVLSIGLAGALDSEARPGQVVIATGAAQHDFDGRPLTPARGIIPGLEIAVIHANAAVADKLLVAARLESKHALPGLVVTGDQIITSAKIRDALAHEFADAVCVDMETAAIAQVAHQNGVPWSGIRITSDSADETFNLQGVLGFGLSTAADLFETIIRGVHEEL
jgi:adenosylhomocysteine nucleosidase